MRNSPSQHSVWHDAFKNSADPQRARHYLDLLEAKVGASALSNVSAEEARILCALFSGSQAMSNWLIAHPDALAALKLEHLQYPRRKEGLRREVELWMTPLLEAGDYEAAFARLRQFKQQEMLRIASRDLARLARTTEIIRELSDVADVCLGKVLELCERQLGNRLGQPRHQDSDGNWRPTPFCVLGMGKLGGQELNYSSDVDVLFVYDDEGLVAKNPKLKGTPPSGSVTNHKYFTRLAETFIAEVSRLTADGMLYRIDLRLRPEGDAGPLARSLASYENYYAQWGQTWERMMLIKARCVAGDESLAGEFLEMAHSFRYPRSPGEGVLREVAAMKDRIETEVVKSGELERNVKLGRGGIREIEFVAQTLQLLHAGRQPFLQGAQTLPALEKLREYELLPAAENRPLMDAYLFFRDIEHRLQMEDNLQTHTIPLARPAQERMAALMGFPGWKQFEAIRKRHSDAVRRVYDRLLKADAAETTSAFPKQFDGAEAEWKKVLAGHHFRQVDQAVRMLREFAQGPGYGHVSRRTMELAWQLLPKFFALCPREDSATAKRKETRTVLSDPDRVMTRLDSFIAAYGTRALLFETWNSNPAVFELLLMLFDRSEFLAEVAIHNPELVDELVTSGRLRQQKTAPEILRDLRYGANDADQRLWIRRYHQAELMRIALREILGLADFEQNLVELSALADACLQYALEVVLRKNRIKTAPLAIIGLGKLGGAEINYGSDLDIVFVTNAKARELPRLQRLAIGVMDLLSSRTEFGIAFLTDARLRPDGEKGLLVNNLEAYESYYRQRAQLWEIQSISRTRPVAGDKEIGEQFQKIAASVTDFRPQKSGAKSNVAAYTPEWRERIHEMRQRIEKERTPAGKDALAIKTGAGGLMDAEFLAQTFCLGNGWQEANTLRALIRARDEKALSRGDADKLMENYRFLRRVEGILRRWSFEGETVLPDEDAPYYRVSVRCGFRTPEEFREALAKCRRSIRSVYNKVFCK